MKLAFNRIGMWTSIKNISEIADPLLTERTKEAPFHNFFWSKDQKWFCYRFIIKRFHLTARTERDRQETTVPAGRIHTLIPPTSKNGAVFWKSMIVPDFPRRETKSYGATFWKKIILLVRIYKQVFHFEVIIIRKYNHM